MPQTAISAVAADYNIISAEITDQTQLMPHDEPHPEDNCSYEFKAIDASTTADNSDQQYYTEAHHHQRIKSSSSAHSLRTKYCLTDDAPKNSITGNGSLHIEHDQANHMEHANTGKIMLPEPDQMKGSACRLPLHEKYNYIASSNDDGYHHDRDVQHEENPARLQHHIKLTNGIHRKKSERIATSTLHAAQVQAAELRALHSAVINSLATDMHNGIISQRPLLTDEYVVHSKGKQNKRKSKVYNSLAEGRDQMVEDVGGLMSSVSSASSTVDCFINPVREYPVFMPHSQEDILHHSMDDDISMNRRSSVDTYEAAMREERLLYIFDHENKKSFSRLQPDDHSVHDSNISCLHESLNLPPRSAKTLVNLQSSNHQPLHHMSLNLPQGSQHRLFNATMQNPLFDHNSLHINETSVHSHNEGSVYSPSFTRFGDDLHRKPIQGYNTNKDHPVPKAKTASFQGYTSKQRALLEFLREEPARMRAFNELAIKEAAPSYDVYKSTKQKISIQENNPPLSSMKLTGKAESSRKGDHELRGGGDDDDYCRRRSRELSSTIASFKQTHQRTGHTSSRGHLHRTSAVPGIFRDNCSPAGGVPAVVVPITDARERSIANPSAEDHTKEKPEQKKPSTIKGWFFRGKKKHGNADHPNMSPADTPAPVPAAADDCAPIVSNTSSAAKEQLRSGPHHTTSASEPSSRVLSGLATSDAEKQLEVAMAIDLMQLKVLQANTKRDAAMAEVLELRLAMDSMANKLVEVEKHCESLRTQLMDVQALRKRRGGKQLGADGMKAPALTEKADLWVHHSAASDDEAAAVDRVGVAGLKEEDDDYWESDSHDNREERKAVASTIGTGDGTRQSNSGYGGAWRSSSRERRKPPKKDEFLSAVAEARVGVRQMSRILVEHVEETMQEGRGGEAMEIEEAGEEAVGTKEMWAPIKMMCREARSSGGGGSSSNREVGYCIEALLNMAFYEHFENVGFDRSGAHDILDPTQRAVAFYHSFLKLAKLTASQLLSQPSTLYSLGFDRFCSGKMRRLGRAVGCAGRLWPDELACAFLSAARAIWLLHELAFAYPACPPCIFRVDAHSPFEPRFMELLPTDHHQPVPSSAHLCVSLMVMPGFFIGDDVIKSKVLA